MWCDDLSASVMQRMHAENFFAPGWAMIEKDMNARPISPRIDALEIFVRLARTRNQPAVAAEMGCKQPVVSRQIAALADWLGCDLTKGASPIRLTEDGERFAAIAAEVLEQLREFRAGSLANPRTDGGNIVARRVSPISDR